MGFSACNPIRRSLRAGVAFLDALERDLDLLQAAATLPPVPAPMTIRITAVTFDGLRTALIDQRTESPLGHPLAGLNAAGAGVRDASAAVAIRALSRKSFLGGSDSLTQWTRMVKKPSLAPGDPRFPWETTPQVGLASSAVKKVPLGFSYPYRPSGRRCGCSSINS